MRKILLISLVVLSLGVLHISAQNSVDDQDNVNDPNDNNRANACYEGGTLEGLCNSEVMWQAGWYLIRVEYDIYDRADVPTWVAWVLPPEVVPEDIIPDPIDPVQCYNNGSKSFVFDSNNLNRESNALVLYDNVTCASGGIIEFTTLIEPEFYEFGILTATDEADAMSQCITMLSEPGTFTFGYNVEAVTALGYNTPANWYACVAETGPVP